MAQKQKPRREYRTFGVWDIETSVAVNEDGRPYDTWLSYGVIGCYLTKDGRPAFRRLFVTWDEFKKALDDIVKLTGGREFILYAHNFAFEGDFLIKHVGHVKSVIANGVHRPIALRLVEWPSIEFRCSWKLLDESVARIGKRVGLPKLEGDYSPLPRGTMPDKTRVEYCTRDCDIVARGIAPYITEYGNIFKVPYTKTGIVRGLLKEYCRRMEPGRDWDLTPPDNLYKIMRESFYGGIAISNPEKTGYTVKNVASFDMSSAYPFAALSEEFPRKMTEGNPKEFDKNGWWIARIRFRRIRSRYNWGWLPSSRMDADDDALLFNGKIIEADTVEATVTNIDFHNIEMTYTFGSFKVLEYYPLFDVQKLPKPIYALFEDLAEAKQTAKAARKKNPTPENCLTETKAKRKFNSLYGMMVQVLHNEGWRIDENGTWWPVDEEPEEERRPKHHCRSYLFGVFITAFCRRNLLRFYVANAGDRLVFGDTDSCKCVVEPGQAIINTNADGMARINRDKVGNLGEWERETFRLDEGDDAPMSDTIDEFRTYGAKKYWFRTGNVTHVTVAGLPAVNIDGSVIDMSDTAFRLGHTWENCKLARVFIGGGRAVSVWESGQTKTIDPAPPDAGGVALYPVGYTLGMTKNDLTYIRQLYGRVIL